GRVGHRLFAQGLVHGPAHGRQPPVEGITWASGIAPDKPAEGIPATAAVWPVCVGPGRRRGATRIRQQAEASVSAVWHRGLRWCQGASARRAGREILSGCLTVWAACCL